METFDFSEALPRLRAGKRVRRDVWIKPIQWLELNTDAVGQFLGVKTNAEHMPIPWLTSQEPILATDWVEVPDEG